MLRLLAIHSHEEHIFALRDDEAILGSAAENDFVLRAPGVSRRHAILRRTPEGIEVIDLSSKNGLYVQGARVRSALLKPGLKLQIGAAWLEVEEIATSREALARLAQDTSETITLEPPGGLQAGASDHDALALAQHVAQVGPGLPGRRADLLSRIKATLGAEAFGSFERTARGQLRILESVGELHPDDRRLLSSLVAGLKAPAQGPVALKSAGRVLLAGREVWFLGATFKEESLASSGWRKDLLRILAHQFFLPVRSFEDLKATEVYRVLALARGNKKRAASLLGISRGTLHNILARRRTSKS